MGNKQVFKKKPSRKRQLKRFQKTMMEVSKNRGKKHRIKSLAILCCRVLQKYKLPIPNKLNEGPKTSIVVGGKSLRERIKRPATPPPQLKPKKPRKKRKPKKIETVVVKPKPVRIKQEPELDLPADENPLTDSEPDIEYYTVHVKEEPVDDQETPREESLDVVVKKERQADSEVEISCTLPLDAPMQNQGESSGSLAAINTTPTTIIQPIPYILDQFQVFANSVASQLRRFPANRAILLQLEIQTMLDNERQLLFHEN